MAIFKGFSRAGKLGYCQWHRRKGRRIFFLAAGVSKTRHSWHSRHALSCRSVCPMPSAVRPLLAWRDRSNAFLTFFNMESVEELRELIADSQRRQEADNARTQEAFRNMMNAIAAIAPNIGAVPGAAPPVLTPIRKSSETTVQLSLSDEQYTVAELGEAPHSGAAPPTNSAT